MDPHKSHAKYECSIHSCHITGIYRWPSHGSPWLLRKLVTWASVETSSEWRDSRSSSFARVSFSSFSVSKWSWTWSSFGIWWSSRRLSSNGVKALCSRAFFSSCFRAAISSWALTRSCCWRRERSSERHEGGRQLVHYWFRFLLKKLKFERFLCEALLKISHLFCGIR